ncbi:MAG: ABC-F family ATP-binding cassette domain-containing protein [Chloroflexota bacterium]|nr:ABC-F family ATP-binding cassette domain-containing protein [Dehalococcoidia bacterium]MDW8255043.1 ABC-F family ATP-binding cassette domain-containing protein [Chloroflexota bacterium]
MLRVVRVSKSYGARTVLREVSFEIRPGERVGLVGANGAGKTTLLDIIRGALPADAGQVILAPGWRIGYLAQDTGLDPHWTVRQAMWQVFDELLATQRELAEIGERLRHLAPNDPALMALIHRQAELHEAFDRLEGHTAEAEIGKVLHGLGFSDDEAERPVSAFSGGWQVRIALARLLLGRNELLLLDEPTNHLDASAVDWLEEYLTSRPRTALIVSHDRYFLDRVTTRTLELENHVITSYPGSYRNYAEEKARRLAAQEAAARRQAEYLAAQRETLERFRANASKASFVQSREKQLAKLKIVEAPREERPPAFRFAEAPQSGRDVLRVRAVSKTYGETVVFRDVEFLVERGDRLALLGPNGAGKSTLLRLLARLEKPDSGSVTWGQNVRVGYFAQNAADVLDENMRVIDAVTAVAPLDWSEGAVRSMLARFLFRGDEVFKKIRVLSGGERNRVALARLLVRPYNVLLLDEPTNHLDIPAREALQAALAAFPGTLVFVSHDRYLVDRLATKILALADGKATLYDGDYQFYLRKRAEPAGAPLPLASPAPSPLALQPGRDVARKARRSAASAARALAQIEAALEEREERKAEVEAALADPATYRDPALSAELLEEHARLEAEIEALLERWAVLAEDAG